MKCVISKKWNRRARNIQYIPLSFQLYLEFRFFLFVFVDDIRKLKIIHLLIYISRFFNRNGSYTYINVNSVKLDTFIGKLWHLRQLRTREIY